MKRFGWVIAATLTTAHLALAQEAGQPKQTNSAAVREISKGVYEIGKVRVDAAKKSVSFPVTLNMKEGPIEYLLVTTKGKVHESVLRTDVEPFHIHTAMLLLGARGAGLTQPPQGPPGPTYEPARLELKGEDVAIQFSWEEKGKTVTRAAEELLVARSITEDAEGKPVVTKMNFEAKWIYNGSAVLDGKYLADLSGSIISLITDASAVINNVGQGHENDEIWGVNAEKAPPHGLAVTATVRILPSKKPAE